jgi:hypothetical protein
LHKENLQKNAFGNFSLKRGANITQKWQSTSLPLFATELLTC